MELQFKPFKNALKVCYFLYHHFYFQKHKTRSLQPLSVKKTKDREEKNKSVCLKNESLSYSYNYYNDAVSYDQSKPLVNTEAIQSKFSHYHLLIISLEFKNHIKSQYKK